MKRGKRNFFDAFSLEFISISLLIGFLIYFFLSVSYNLSFFEKILISIISLIVFFISRKRSLYEFSLAFLVGLTSFVSLEISFNLSVFFIFLISLFSIFVVLISYNKMNLKDKYALILFVWFLVVWTILAFNVSYREDWLLENYLTIPFLILIFLSYRWFKFSNLSYSLIFIYLVLHIVGSHYTYSEVPFGFWMQSFFELGRNHYDRIVHFAFGFLLAYPLREFFIKISNVRGFWALYIPIEFVLAFSCIYELIEWGIAVIFGGDLGVAYLGSQGDVWDAQKDMALAGLGSVLAMLGTFSILMYYNRKNYLHEIKESFSIKKKRSFGERVLARLMNKK